jgi:hypothetical protein
MQKVTEIFRGTVYTAHQVMNTPLETAFDLSAFTEKSCNRKKSKIPRKFENVVNFQFLIYKPFVFSHLLENADNRNCG